jgi:Ca2+/H+ antiporter
MHFQSQWLNFIICIFFYKIKEESSETDSQRQSRNKPEPKEEEEEPEIGLWESVAWLALLTLWVSVLSEYLVNAIQVFPLLTILVGRKEKEIWSGSEL